MSIALPELLPAADVLLSEGVPVLARQRTPFIRGRSLRIGVLNLMPNKTATECQLARMLARTRHHVELVLFHPDGYQSRTTSREHMQRFYRTWSEVAEQSFDGIIITGAPVETLDFETVSYWSNLSEILSWVDVRGIPTLAICWAAQAALYHFHDIGKEQLPAKLFGVYAQQVVLPDHPLLHGIGSSFDTPVSRHTTVEPAALFANPALQVLAGSQASGLGLVHEPARRFTYSFNHPEYDTDTLAHEYERDVACGAGTRPPRRYYPNDDITRKPINTWSLDAMRLYGNWLNEVCASTHLLPRREVA